MIPESPYANFNRISLYETQGWKNSLINLEKEKPDVWDISSNRQKHYIQHKNTKSIPIIYDEKLSDTKNTQTIFFPFFSHLINPLEEKLNSIYGDGIILRLILTKQETRSIITPHQDGAETFRTSHRVHLPLYTANTRNYGDTLFCIGNVDPWQSSINDKHINKRWIQETVPMCVGEMWEINNIPDVLSIRHSVINHSIDVEKIHLIMDWKPKNMVFSFNKKELDKDKETLA
jgi:hypothetical protein